MTQFPPCSRTRQAVDPEGPEPTRNRNDTALEQLACVLGHSATPHVQGELPTIARLRQPFKWWTFAQRGVRGLLHISMVSRGARPLNRPPTSAFSKREGPEGVESGRRTARRPIPALNRSPIGAVLLIGNLRLLRAFVECFGAGCERPLQEIAYLSQCATQNQ